MKKGLRFLLAFCIAFLLAACGVGPEAAADLPEVSADLSDSEVTEEAAADLQGSEVTEETAADLPDSEMTEEPVENEQETGLLEDGTYTSKEDVALYIHQYGHLPANFITKKEAEALGWQGGSLEPYAPGMCIGGSHFGNYEGLLPEKDGRSYTECDIDTLGASKRGAKRIVYSNDGLIYYTEDHYESFELLYGEEP